jgi:hypothetical protein
MTARTDVLDLVERWATAEQGGDNSGRFRLSLVAARPGDRWLLANTHIGMLQEPAGRPPEPRSES